MIEITYEKKAELEQIIEKGKQSGNMGTINEMQKQYNTLVNWLRFLVEPSEREQIELSEIYMKISPIEVEDKLADALLAIGDHKFQPSYKLGMEIESNAAYRHRVKSGMLFP